MHTCILAFLHTLHTCHKHKSSSDHAISQLFRLTMTLTLTLTLTLTNCSGHRGAFALKNTNRAEGHGANARLFYLNSLSNFIELSHCTRFNVSRVILLDYGGPFYLFLICQRRHYHWVTLLLELDPLSNSLLLSLPSRSFPSSNQDHCALEHNPIWRLNSAVAYFAAWNWRKNENVPELISCNRMSPDIPYTNCRSL